MKYDVVIVGSGFGGAVCAMILSKLKYKVLLVEKNKHPRFALGESTTPVVTKTLRFLSEKYDIPELSDYATYSGMKKSDSSLMCGPKELFHYFWHSKGQEKAKVDNEYHEIFVQTPDVSPQLLRSDFDAKLVVQAQQYGSHYIDCTTVEDVCISDNEVTLKLNPDKGDEYSVSAKYLIDATGFRSLLCEKLDLRVPEKELDTPLASRAIFTHFKSVGTLEEAVGNDIEFNERCTVDRLRATQHHCFEGGWYWFIPFDDGVTSVGVNLDLDVYPNNDLGAEEEFWKITNQFPIIKRMLEGRETINIPYIKTGRLQFKAKQAVGDRWALLPAAAVGVDGWFSTGLSLTLISVHRIVEKLNMYLPGDSFKRADFLDYETSLFKEWKNITKMIDGTYKSFKHWDLFKSYCFLCFMGAESYVHSKGYEKPDDETMLLLNVGNDEFLKHFDYFYKEVITHYKANKLLKSDTDNLQKYLTNNMEGFNFREYGNPDKNGIYYKQSKSSPYYFD